MYALARMAWPAVCWPVLFSRALVAFKAFEMVTRFLTAILHHGLRDCFFVFFYVTSKLCFEMNVPL